jgi:hypothetical protein
MCRGVSGVFPNDYTEFAIRGHEYGLAMHFFSSVALTPCQLAAVRTEQILGQVSLQWLTNTSAGASMFHHTERNVEARANHGPIGVAVFADDFRSIIRSPNATTPTSCLGRSIQKADTLPPWKSRTN